MNIVLAVHCFFPDHIYGTETYTLQLAHGLRAAGHQVTVFTALFPGEPPTAEEVTRYEWQGIPVVCFDKNRNPNTRVKDTYYQPSQRAVLEHLLREIKPDAVHVTHLINHTAALLEATQSLGIPTVATFTDFFGICLNNKLVGADGTACDGPNRTRSNCLACHFKDAFIHDPKHWKRLLAKWPWSRIGAEIATVRSRMITTGALAGLTSDIACRPEILKATYASYRMAITPSSILRDAYSRTGFRFPLRDIRFGTEIDRRPKEACAPETPLRIGFIGQLAYHKGPDLLIEAIRGLPSDRVSLTIHGPHDQDPAYMKRLRQAAEGLPVTFPGTFPREQLAQVLAGFDVLAMPSRWAENSPLALLNALATHTPVLVTDMGGMTEFLHPDGAGGYLDGFVFPLGDFPALRRLVHAAVAAPQRVRGMTTTTSYARTTADMVAETIVAYREAGLPV